MPEQNHASLVCVPCKRRKKRCDKRLPICSRCERLNANCCYPNDVADLNTQQQPQGAHGMTCSPLHCISPNASSCSFPNFDEIAASSLHNLAGCVDLVQSERDIVHYFSIYHINLPILNKEDFTWKLQRNSQEPHFILLRLAISVVAQLTSEQPGGFQRGMDLYSPLKAIYVQYQNGSSSSIDLLLAGLLIANYEYCQHMLKQSWFTVGACVRMGQILMLELYGNDEGQSNPIWWWGVVILERIIAADYMANRLPIASDSPTLSDALPVMDVMDSPGRLLGHDLFLAEQHREQDVFVRPPVTFTSLTPFSTTLQATYLNCLVTEHIMHGSEDFSTRRLQTERLTLILQHFEEVLILPPGEAVGHHCGAYGLQTCALFRLHENEIEHAQKVIDLTQLARSKHFLQSHTRNAMVSLRVLETGVPPDIATLALWSHKIIYHAAMSHIRYGVRDDEWASDLERCKIYLRFLADKMKLHEHYLHEIEDEELAIGINGPKDIAVKPLTKPYATPVSVRSCRSMT